MFLDMNYNENKVVIKIVQSNSSQCFRILSAWDNNNVFLNIICATEAYIGYAAEKQLIAIAKDHHLEFTNYKLNLLQYLHDSTLSDILLQILDDSFIIWKKVNNIKLKFFTIKLEPTDFNESICNMVDFLLGNNSQLKSRVNELEIRKQEADTLKDESVRKLEEYVNLHVENEQRLYSNFVLLVNEKKKHIQHLTATIERINLTKDVKHTEVFTSDEESVDGYETPPRKLEKISDSESDDTKNSTKGDELLYDSGNEPSTSKNTVNILLRDNSNSPPPVPLKKIKASACINEIENKMVENTKQKVNKTETIQVNVSNKQTENEEESPTLDFNTQDLLNRL